MQIKISKAIQEFKKYSQENIYSIGQIKFWIEEYQSLYEYAKLYWNNDSCCGVLPCSCTLNNELSKFISFYESLNTIIEYHNFESLFKDELFEYQNIKDNLQERIKWIKKNEKLGASVFVTFTMDYLDYSENPYHLKVFISSYKDLPVFIDRKYFVNTITFLEVFNRFFWVENSLLEGV